MRMDMRRFTRLTNALSKKIENLRAAVSLHFAHYNFVRVHQSLRVTTATQADITGRLWSLDELVERTLWTSEQQPTYYVLRLRTNISRVNLVYRYRAFGNRG